MQPDKLPQPADAGNVASTGNASNPTPAATPPESSQLLGKEAEKYLREGANIEDLPDAQDQQNLDETIASESAPE